MAIQRHEIPTHLNVEDRAFFGLSVRQFTDLIAGLAGTYSLWHQAASWPAALRLAVTSLSLLIALAMALLKPGGRRLEQWLLVWLHYLFTPRRATWRPRRPDPREWRPAARAWPELAPRLL
ncbi:MAG TPA: PrgI family protein, partial [Chloroflexota bacterium]